MVAFAGAGPWPQITSVLPARASLRMTGTSPPGPLRCGSTTCSVKAVATAASKALPPFSSVAIPTAVAIQWVEVTTPNVPSISGRDVNGSGLILPVMVLVLLYEPSALDHSGSALPRVGIPAFSASQRSGRRRSQVHGMAGDAVDQCRRLFAAQVEGERASRVESAPRRRIDRVGDFTL